MKIKNKLTQSQKKELLRSIQVHSKELLIRINGQEKIESDLTKGCAEIEEIVWKMKWNQMAMPFKRYKG